MRLKKINVFFLLLVTFILCASGVFAEISSTDKTQLQNQVNMIANSINDNNVSAILDIISQNARPELKSEIKQNLGGRMIQFQQSIDSYEDLGNNQVKIEGRYSAAGVGWSINGMSNYYVFENSGDSWLLVDTNFHQKLGGGYVFKTIGKVFLILFPIAIVIFIFWLWMLIDAIRRQFDNKTLWIILIVVLGLIGALLYMFIKRRKLKKQEKNFENQPTQ